MVIVAVVHAGWGGFISGLFLGLLLGLVAAPLLWSWLAHREWARASRRARLTDEVLDRMHEPFDPEDPGGRTGERELIEEI